MSDSILVVVDFREHRREHTVSLGRWPPCLEVGMRKGGATSARASRATPLYNHVSECQGLILLEGTPQRSLLHEVDYTSRRLAYSLYELMF